MQEGLQIGAPVEISKWRRKDYKSGQRFQIGAKRFQIGAGITNRCRTRCSILTPLSNEQYYYWSHITLP